MKVFFNTLARIAGYSFAAVIIAAAALVCIGRLLTPIFDGHRADFEKWASTLLQSPVTISTARVSWYQYQPEISLNGVTVLNKDGTKPLLQIQNVSVLLSIPQSVWQRKLVASGILITGAHIDLHENANGKITVKGFPEFSGLKDKPYENETNFSDVIIWLSTQPRLILNNIDGRYYTFKGHVRHVTLENLSFINSSDQHSILGKATLHQEIPTEITVALQWQGEKVELNQIHANLYIYISGLSLTQWMKDVSWNGWQVNHGMLSAKMWVSFNHGALQKIQTLMQAYDLNLSSALDKSTHVINRLSGNFGWKRQDKKMVIVGDDVLIDLPQHLWPVNNFQLVLSQTPQDALLPQSFSATYINLADIEPYVLSLKSLPQNLNQLLVALHLQGDLENVELKVNGNSLEDWQHTSFKTNFNSLHFSAWDGLPGIHNLSGKMTWNGSLGDLSLQSQDLSLQYDSLLANAINLQSISGDVQFSYAPNRALQFHTAGLALKNRDFSLTTKGTLTFPAAFSPIADISADFNVMQAQNVTSYLPQKIMDRDLNQWLKKAFLSGQLENGHVIVKGVMANIPFDKAPGTLSLMGEVKQMNLHFSPQWPTLTNLNAKLIFANQLLQIEATHAEFLTIPINNIHATISDLISPKPATLSLQLNDIAMDMQQGMKIIHGTSLENSLGTKLASIEMNGPMQLTLGLMMQLNLPSATHVNGKLALTNVNMHLIPADLSLQNIAGDVAFTEDSINANGLKGILFNKPLLLNINTLTKPKYMIKVTLANSLAIEDVATLLKLPLAATIHGEAEFTEEIDLIPNTPTVIHIQSNLKGMAIDFIAPFGKKADEIKDFSLDVTAAEKAPLKLKINYSKLLSAALLLEPIAESYHLFSADIHVSSGDATWSTSPGLFFMGYFDELDADKIKPYLDQESSSTFSNLLLQQLDINSKLIKAYGLIFTNMQLHAESANDNWDVGVNSDQAVGELHLPKEFNNRHSLSAKFKKIIFLNSSDTKNKNSPLNIKSLPAINFEADQVIVNKMQLGKMTFKTTPSSNGLTIQSFTLLSAWINLKAQGSWVQSAHNNVSRLQGSAKSTQVSALLNSLNLDVHNFIANNGQLNFDLNWQDAPYAPSIALLDGKAKLNLGKGRIVDIGQESGAKMDLGRMLSIFSLQTIPRRLSFDFSDVFEKGYSFDSIKGDFIFRNGDAYTNNFKFDGPVASVGINGRIGIDEKDYDFTLSVTPYVTSSIPIAATLLTGQPLIGLAVLAVSSVITSEVSKVTSYYYTVTGSWSNPVWKSVNTYKKKA